MTLADGFVYDYIEHGLPITSFKDITESVTKFCTASYIAFNTLLALRSDETAVNTGNKHSVFTVQNYFVRNDSISSCASYIITKLC